MLGAACLGMDGSLKAGVDLPALAMCFCQPCNGTMQT